MEREKSEIYIVGHRGPEHNKLLGGYKTYRGAFGAWNRLRIKLLEEARKNIIEDCRKRYDTRMHREQFRNLSCCIPDNMDNYPFETPYIEKIDLRG